MKRMVTSQLKTEKLLDSCSNLTGHMLVGGTAPDSTFHIPDAVELDIGCANGRFLVEMAQLYPERHFVGVERQSKRVFKTNKKIVRLGLTNAVVHQADGFEFLRDSVSTDSVDVVHVLFPDPWPKRRHAVRRLVQVDFLREIWRCLKIGGVFRFRTDAEAYCHEVLEKVGKMECWEFTDSDRVYPITDFELRFREEGLPIFSVLAKKVFTSAECGVWSAE